jgi:hypothetical protein
MIQHPTVREFIQAAVAQNCREHIAKTTLVGPRGAAQMRALISADGKMICVMPNDDQERLTPTAMASYVRNLGLKGFEDLLGDLLTDD